VRVCGCNVCVCAYVVTCSGEAWLCWRFSSGTKYFGVCVYVYVCVCSVRVCVCVCVCVCVYVVTCSREACLC